MTQFDKHSLEDKNFSKINMNKRTASFKTIVMSNLGASLEYYDYVLYAMLSVYIAEIFFPKTDLQIQQIQSILLFAVGTFARLCGGLIFGAIGDKFGRRNSMTISIIMMGIATFIMGILPTYNDIGIAATIMLTACRFAQGMAFGAEVPSTAVFISESTSGRARSLNIGILNASISIGSIIASFVIFILSCLLRAEEIMNFGWRIPLILGGMVGIFGYFMRKNMPESSEFASVIIKQSKQGNLMQLFSLKMLPRILVGILVMSLPASFIITNIYFPMLLGKFFSYTVKNVSFYITVSLLFATILNPICGYLIDRFGKKIIMLGTYGVFCSCYVPIVIYMNHYGSDMFTKSDVYLLIFLFIYQLLTILAFNFCVSQMLTVFPIEIRNTGFAMIYNLASFCASFIPILLIQYMNSLLLIVIPLVISLAAIIGLQLLQHSKKLFL